jgi:hypothetical protein
MQLILLCQSQDEELGFDFPTCVKYRRTVEMYQWIERKHEEEENKLGGGKEVKTTYTYVNDDITIQPHC